jgi:hypothetical protein
LISSIRIIAYKKNVELKNIFNLVNFQDFNFKIVMRVEAISKLLQIYIFLSTYFISWDNWTKIFWKLDTFSTIILQKWKVLIWYQCPFRIWKSLVIWSLKIWFFELFNYLIWYDTKNVELKLKLSGLYYKHVTIVNDDSSVVSKWNFKLIDNPRVIIYDRHRLIIQATVWIIELFEKRN